MSRIFPVDAADANSVFSSQATRRHSQICVACPTCQGKSIRCVEGILLRMQPSVARLKKCTSKASSVPALAPFCSFPIFPKAWMHESAPRLQQQQQLSPWLQISERLLSLFTYSISANQISCIAPHVLLSILQNAYVLFAKGMMRRRKTDAMTGLAILDLLSVQSRSVHGAKWPTCAC